METNVLADQKLDTREGAPSGGATAQPTDPTALPQTKDLALEMLGVRSKRSRRRIAPFIEFRIVPSGTTIVTENQPTPAVHIGVASTVTVQYGSSTTSLEGEFFFAAWSLRNSHFSRCTVTAATDTAILTIDRRNIDQVLTVCPYLDELAVDTEAAVTTG